MLSALGPAALVPTALGETSIALCTVRVLLVSSPSRVMKPYNDDDDDDDDVNTEFG